MSPNEKEAMIETPSTEASITHAGEQTDVRGFRQYQVRRYVNGRLDAERGMAFTPQLGLFSFSLGNPPIPDEFFFGGFYKTKEQLEEWLRAASR